MHDQNEREPLTLYLDIDGVVTTAAYQRKAGKDKLDPAAVAIVAALMRDFGAVVVVSSTWRVADCRPTLVEAGLPEDRFHADWRTAIPATSRDPETGAMLPAERARRGEEIADHASRNGITRYLVLDDVEIGDAHAGRHVKPNPERGLTEAEASLARSLVARLDAT
ncbi:HAD domain-containing protein [Lichenihabitans sp. Uapishka_5]|uniref:HAD domain-containing protein n=1 Tax=Lichenihabitans sp. Uapishka_5 TaxID=3037302 RepID=UPI0029E816AD|nr:HAD domain-containing protein [Lichenihabitans sp. Uapishka_5]MDX7952113.1 HAD domain-containing protein [Lichenihabitans sp. Uapishka_5]